MIIFTEKDSFQIAAAIEEMNLSGVKVTNVNTVEKAESLGLYHSMRIDELVVIHEVLSRGYDMKLAKDAYVYMVALDKGFPLSKVHQMLGRGSRAFGQCRGAYYTFEWGKVNEDLKIKLLKKEP